MECIFKKSIKIPRNVKSLIMISDIHGVLESLIELEKVVRNLESEGSAQIIVLGDIMAGGINPLEVLEWVRKKAGEYACLGNHDIKALKSPNEPAHMCTEQGVRHLLGEHHLEYLRSLPLVLDLTWHSRRIVCTHGQVSHLNKPLSNRELPHELFEKCADPGIALTVTGHTHFPFVLEKNGRIAANTGSTSRLMYGISSRNGPVISLETGDEYKGGKNVFSSCLVVRDTLEGLDVQIQAFDYDRNGYVRKLKEAGDPWFDINKIIFETGVAYW